MPAGIKKYLAESVLIVFSVLFALFINQQFDEYQTHKRKNEALESIRKELYRNQAIVSSWKDKHQAILVRIASVLDGENDSLEQALLQEKYLDIGLLTNQESIIDAVLTSTAWEAANATGIISEFNFNTTQKLTHVYSMQDVMVNRTMGKIVDYYFDSSSHDLNRLEPILLQFQLRFWELTGQEVLMEELYAAAIDELNQH
jgi:hypothetical protein